MPKISHSLNLIQSSQPSLAGRTARAVGRKARDSWRRFIDSQRGPDPDAAEHLRNFNANVNRLPTTLPELKTRGVLWDTRQLSRARKPNGRLI